jgi:ectoine hydroxylase-related dioxygenase (phytanoyl-CoA dioxygenase family)
MTFEEHTLAIEVAGFTVMQGLLTASECDAARAALERIFAAEQGLPGVAQHRYTAQAYSLMNKAPIFERFYQLPPLLRLIRHFLGEDAVLSSIQAHRVSPGAPDQGLHYDGSITGPFKSNAPADAGRRIVSHVLGFNVVFCITDFTRTNGATRLVPGSQTYPGVDVPRDRTVPGETIIEASAGSVLVFNIATWHGQSANTSDDIRYAVMSPWRRSWIRPEADLPRIVIPEIVERAGSEGRRIFGFSSRAPYTDRWQWDMAQGRPREEWAHLMKDEL